MTRKISIGINSLESVKIWNKEIFCFLGKHLQLNVFRLKPIILQHPLSTAGRKLKVNKYFEAG